MAEAVVAADAVGLDGIGLAEQQFRLQDLHLAACDNHADAHVATALKCFHAEARRDALCHVLE